MNAILTIISFEFLRTVKKPGFGAATLFVPAFIALSIGVSSYGINSSRDSFSATLASAPILLVDKSDLIQKDLLPENITVSTEEKNEAVQKVQQNTFSALIYLPPNFREVRSYELFAQSNGVVSNNSYGPFVEYLVRSSILQKVGDTDEQLLVTNPLKEIGTYYDTEGSQVGNGYENMILPGLSFFIFFMAVFISAQYLLQSVSEEKENRMVETLLSIVKPRDLIWGKIFGLSLVALTQLLLWFVGAGLAIWVFSNKIQLPVDLDLEKIMSSISPIQMLIVFVFTLLGYFLFAAVMVGVGAISTSQRESQSLSSIFIISAVLPIYSLGSLISDPNGTLAQVFTYFPFSSAFTLLLRNGFGSLTTAELVLGLILNILYVILALWIAVKLFNLGILMYNQRPTIKDMLYAMKR